MFPKPKTERDERYLTWVRSLPCLCCGNARGFRTEAHHVNPEGRGGKAIKTDDRRCIPLCTLHHREHDHVGKRTFARWYEIDYEATIARLNIIYERRNL